MLLLPQKAELMQKLVVLRARLIKLIDALDAVNRTAGLVDSASRMAEIEDNAADMAELRRRIELFQSSGLAIGEAAVDFLTSADYILQTLEGPNGSRGN